ncbi:hypothetical protein N9L68_01685 [bacterium]|nr:hypothetical protein [bacterium]
MLEDSTGLSSEGEATEFAIGYRYLRDVLVVRDAEGEVITCFKAPKKQVWSRCQNKMLRKEVRPLS